MRGDVLLGSMLAALAGYGTVFYLKQELALDKANSVVIARSKRVDERPKNRLSHIRKIIEEKKSLNMQEIHLLFPNVSRRTLRRDMNRLESEGVVKQVGLTKDARYIYVS